MRRAGDIAEAERRRIAALERPGTFKRFSRSEPTIWRLAAVLATLGVLALLVLGAGPSRLDSILQALLHGDLKLARARLNAMGAWEIVAIVTLVLAHTALPFPTELVAAAAGFSLGFAVALPILLGSLLVSALLTYGLGLWLGRPAVIRLLGDRRLRRVERLVDRGGFSALLAVRLFPLVPFSPVGLVCGLSRVPVRRFMWGTALGILPELALVTYLGQRLQSPQLNDLALWVPLLTVVALLLIAPPLIRRHRIRA